MTTHEYILFSPSVWGDCDEKFSCIVDSATWPNFEGLAVARGFDLLAKAPTIEWFAPDAHVKVRRDVSALLTHLGPEGPRGAYAEQTAQAMSPLQLGLPGGSPAWKVCDVNSRRLVAEYFAPKLAEIATPSEAWLLYFRWKYAMDDGLQLDLPVLQAAILPLKTRADEEPRCPPPATP